MFFNVLLILTVYIPSVFVFCQQMVIVFAILESNGINVPNPAPALKAVKAKLLFRTA